METPADELIAACAELQQSDDPSPELLATTRAFLTGAVTSGALPDESLAALETLPPHGAGWLAVAFGSGVEHGLDPRVSASAIVKCFRASVEALARGNATKAHEEALPSVAQSVVAHVARLPELRQELGADTQWMQLLQECEPHSHAIVWVLELLRRRSGDLFVVHGDSRRAFKLRFENVSNCFHLFSLLQSAAGKSIPGGERPDQKVAAAARGGESDGVSDRAWWHYQLRGAKVNVGDSVWGEAHVDTLRQDDGSYAMTLWNTVLSNRTWNAGFFSPALEAAPSMVELDGELDTDAANVWCERLLSSST